MELNEILISMKEYGIIPVIMSFFILYFIKNKNKITKTIADHISKHLQHDRQKLLNKIENELLIKDIQILELYLLNQTYNYSKVVMTIYKKYKDDIKNKMNDFKKEIINYFKQSSINDEIKSYKIRADIIQFYTQEIRDKALKTFFARLFEAISINGHANHDIFKTLLRDLLNNFAKSAVDEIEKKYLYEKL